MGLLMEVRPHRLHQLDGGSHRLLQRHIAIAIDPRYDCRAMRLGGQLVSQASHLCHLAGQPLFGLVQVYHLSLNGSSLSLHNWKERGQKARYTRVKTTLDKS